MQKDKRIRTLDGRAIHIDPGVYQLSRPLHIPRTSKREDKANFAGRDWWPAGELFIINKQIDVIGGQTAFQYYTVNRFGSDYCQIKSYESERWNMLIAFLKPLDE
jgi:hypothetical protein